MTTTGPGSTPEKILTSTTVPELNAYDLLKQHLAGITPNTPDRCITLFNERATVIGGEVSRETSEVTENRNRFIGELLPIGVVVETPNNLVEIGSGKAKTVLNILAPDLDIAEAREVALAGETTPDVFRTTFADVVVFASRARCEDISDIKPPINTATRTPITPEEALEKLRREDDPGMKRRRAQEYLRAQDIEGIKHDNSTRAVEVNWSPQSDTARKLQIRIFPNGKILMKEMTPQPPVKEA